MRKLIGMSMLLIGVAGLAMAAAPPAEVPEIDLSAGVGAFTLLSGGLLVIRSRGKK